MKQAQLIPKPKKRMRQPTKADMRQNLIDAAETIINLGGRVIDLHNENEDLRQQLRRPWWRRIFGRDVA